MEPKYKIEGALRRILPYHWKYSTFCKQRWRDRNILEIFSSDFRQYPKEYYEERLNAGGVLVNNKPATVDTIIKNGDLIEHTIHRHEPPVPSQQIGIVFQNENILVIDKPSGIPVHPTGRYRFQTVTMILENELGFKVYPCNRLDRLTSGIMFLGKNTQGANTMSDQIKARSVSKSYIAKVVGEFPLGVFDVLAPLHTLEPRLTFNIIDLNGTYPSKEANTTFQRISYDPKSNTSIVLCKPHTGRTHQIRVHLQYLGHPIINDPLYSCPTIWGPTLGKGGFISSPINDDKNTTDNDQLIKIIDRLDSVGKTESVSSYLRPAKQLNTDNEQHQVEETIGEVYDKTTCPECHLPLHSDPHPDELTLFLHAYSYASTDPSQPWSYTTTLPLWARDAYDAHMLQAIDQARKCSPDATANAFAVGCVIVQNENIVSEGYTRELTGNTHAEENALAKVDSLDWGTELYTSMEPCSLRLSGNLPCVDRIINVNKSADEKARIIKEKIEVESIPNGDEGEIMRQPLDYIYKLPQNDDNYPNLNPYLALKFVELVHSPRLISTVFVGVKEDDTFVEKNVSYEKLEQDGVTVLLVDGWAHEAEKVAKMGHVQASEIKEDTDAKNSSEHSLDPTIKQRGEKRPHDNI